MPWGNDELLIQNREEGGRLLCKKLFEFRNSNSVVVAIPRGGACVGYAIADSLQLPFEVMPCRNIKHPADPSKSIGSVSKTEVFLHDCEHDIPQDYISHQLILLQGSIQREHDFYYGRMPSISLLNKTVILVDDIMKTSDAIIACIRSIKKMKPLRIITAVPVVGAEAARIIRGEADDVIFLRMMQDGSIGKDYFVEFPKVEEKEVQELLLKTKGQLEIA